MLASPYSKPALREAAECSAVVTVGQPDQANVTELRFGRTLRLLKPAEFKRVFEGASRVSTRYLTLLGRANDLGYPRLGLAIAKKSVKRAVDRNQIKRRVRESFRCQQHGVGGIDIVVLAKAGTQAWDWHELRLTLDKKWRELDKRCKEL